MIRTLTIVENLQEDGKVECSATGSLPVEEAAKILVIIAYNVGRKPVERKED